MRACRMWNMVRFQISKIEEHKMNRITELNRRAIASLFVFIQALLSFHIAFAVTSPAPTVTGLVGSSRTCNISFDYFVTGTVDDGSGLDNYSFVARYESDSGGEINTIGGGSTGGGDVAVGTTIGPISGVFKIPVFSFAAVPASNPMDLFVADDSGAAGAVGAQITRNQLIAGGDGCARMAANDAPVADAGSDATITGGAVVVLDGSGTSDADGDSVNFRWVQTSGPTVTLSGASSIRASFTAPPVTSVDQVLIFQLTSSDGLESGTDTVELTIIGVNTPPVADAGSNIVATAGSSVTLDGSGSSDPEGNTITYLWSQLSGTIVTLSDTTAINPTFTAPLLSANEDLVFQLIVNDGVDASPPVTVTVSIEAVGMVRIVQQVIGQDIPVAFTSNIADLNATLTTVGGSGELIALAVPNGLYSITAADLSPQGYALTNLSCSDTDSVVNLSGRTVSLDLSAGEDLTCTFTSTETRSVTQKQIRSFLTGRNAFLLANQPNSGRRYSRLAGNGASAGNISVAGLGVPGSNKLPMTASFSKGQGRVTTSLSQMRSKLSSQSSNGTSNAFDFWAEFQFGGASFENVDYDYTLGFIGADYLIADNLLVGAVAQIDDFNRNDLIGAEGNGWMVGPYLTAKLTQHLYGDFRAAWGSSDNTVSPFGTYTDDFTTNRAMYVGALSGVFSLGEKTIIRPEVSFRHISEGQKAYVDSLGVPISSQTIGQGEIAFRPRIEKVISLSNGWRWSPYISTEGIYTFGADTDNPLYKSVRARLEIGTQIYRSNGIRLNIATSLDGIGVDGYKSFGGVIALSRGF
jgi:chitinase